MRPTLAIEFVDDLHVTVHVFMSYEGYADANNGKLTFTHREWKRFRDAFLDAFQGAEAVRFAYPLGVDKKWRNIHVRQG